MELFGWTEVGSDDRLGYAFLSEGNNTIVRVMEGATAPELYFYDRDGSCVELFGEAGGEGRQAPVPHGPSCLLQD